MSRFSDFLARQLKEQNVSAKDLAARMKLHESVLSGILSGHRKSFNISTAVKLCRGISTDPNTRTAALTAIFSDHGFSDHAVISKARDNASTPPLIDKGLANLTRLIQRGTLSKKAVASLTSLIQELSK
jgi:transcriptional regulator with XRE-family HTH domain